MVIFTRDYGWCCCTRMDSIHGDIYKGLWVMTGHLCDGWIVYLVIFMPLFLRCPLRAYSWVNRSSASCRIGINSRAESYQMELIRSRSNELDHRWHRSSGHDYLTLIECSHYWKSEQKVLWPNRVCLEITARPVSLNRYTGYCHRTDFSLKLLVSSIKSLHNELLPNEVYLEIAAWPV